jgi:hypothetical protein
MGHKRMFHTEMLAYITEHRHIRLICKIASPV